MPPSESRPIRFIRGALLVLNRATCSVIPCCGAIVHFQLRFSDHRLRPLVSDVRHLYPWAVPRTAFSARVRHGRRSNSC